MNLQRKKTKRNNIQTNSWQTISKSFLNNSIIIFSKSKWMNKNKKEWVRTHLELLMLVWISNWKRAQMKRLLNFGKHVKLKSWLNKLNQEMSSSARKWNKSWLEVVKTHWEIWFKMFWKQGKKTKLLMYIHQKMLKWHIICSNLIC